jgi:TPR repeat protein
LGRKNVWQNQHGARRRKARRHGHLYYQGRAGKPDYETARAWFERAAGLGNVSAMLGLGFLYEKGHGVAKDSDQARRWYQKAMADAGNESLKASRTSLR